MCKDEMLHLCPSKSRLEITSISSPINTKPSTFMNAFHCIHVLFILRGSYDLWVNLERLWKISLKGAPQGQKATKPWKSKPCEKILCEGRLQHAQGLPFTSPSAGETPNHCHKSNCLQLLHLQPHKSQEPETPTLYSTGAA